MIVSETEDQRFSNPDLVSGIKGDGNLKEWLVEYVGGKYQKELTRARAESGENIEWNGEVTVEMIIEIMSDEFPEFILALAEENFIRGYRQGLADVDAGMGLADAEQP